MFQFTRYVFDFILQPVENAENTLPKFLIDLFNSYEKLESVLVVGITLLIFQLCRGALMFLNGSLKGVIAEKIAYDMRTQL